jgi:hypothetical protein
MHDKNGKPIKVGDKVIVEAVIEGTSASETFCNVTLGVGRDKEHGEYNIHSTLVVNAKQVELIEGNT